MFDARIARSAVAMAVRWLAAAIAGALLGGDGGALVGGRELAWMMPNGRLPVDPAARALVDLLAKLDEAHQASALREAMDYLGVRLLPRSQLIPGTVALRSSPRR